MTQCIIYTHVTNLKKDGQGARGKIKRASTLKKVATIVWIQ